METRSLCGLLRSDFDEKIISHKGSGPFEALLMLMTLIEVVAMASVFAFDTSAIWKVAVIMSGAFILYFTWKTRWRALIRLKPKRTD